MELYTELLDEISVREVKEDLEENRDVSDISPKHLEDEIVGPRVLKATQKLASKKDRLILLLHY